MLNLTNLTLVLSKPSTLYINNKQLKISSGTYTKTQPLPPYARTLSPVHQDKDKSTGMMYSPFQPQTSSTFKSPPNTSSGITPKN